MWDSCFWFCIPLLLRLLALLCHTTFVTQLLSHTIFSHRTLSNTIFHTQSFTHNFVTHHLCHTPSFTHNFETETLRRDPVAEFVPRGLLHKSCQESFYRDLVQRCPGGLAKTPLIEIFTRSSTGTLPGDLFWRSCTETCWREQRSSLEVIYR